mgnify:CR=1 FL=1
MNLERIGRHLFQASEEFEDLARTAELAAVTRIDHDTAVLRGLTSIMLAVWVLLAQLFVTLVLLQSASELAWVASFPGGLAFGFCVLSAVRRLRLARAKHRAWQALHDQHLEHVMKGQRELRQVVFAIREGST